MSNSRRWLDVGVYRVAGVQVASAFDGFVYDLKRLPSLEHLDGRTIVDFTKDFRASYLVGTKYEEQLIVNSILPERMSISDFPGFNQVRISFEMLRSIIRQDHTPWRTGLSNVSGVYVITDIANGLQYVGSAHGGVGIWQRWAHYAKSGQGENKELRELLKTEGDDYAHYFQLSLIEVCDIDSSSDYIISRERHCKSVLLSREFGYNHN